MKRCLQRFVGILVVTCLCGCMAMKSIPGDQDLGRYLRKGETVTVYTRDGSVTTMLVGKVTHHDLAGSRIRLPYGPVNIPLDDIAEVHAERVHAGRTAGAVVLGMILIPPILILAALGECCFGDC